MRARIPPAARSPQGAATLIGLAVLVGVVVLGPTLASTAADTTSVPNRLEGPSGGHPFGTDALGRDLFARTVVAARLSVLLALGATAIAVVGGLVLGVVTATLPRLPRRAMTTLIDILLSFPWLLLTLFFSVIWGASATSAMLAVGLAGVPSFARITYNLSSSLTGRDFVRAARIVGVGPGGIILRHLIPNIAPPMLVTTTAMASVTLLAFSGLSFLGLGVQAPDYDWGRLLREGGLSIYVNPMAAIGPGIALVLTGLVLNSLGALAGSSAASQGPVARPARVTRAANFAAPAPPPDDTAPVVEVDDLRVAFPSGSGESVMRVAGVSLSIRAGETLGIVGASGSGKSVTAMAIAGLLEDTAEVTATTLSFNGIDLTRPRTSAQEHQLGLELAMVFQDPLSSLNPALTIGRQLTEVTQVHQRESVGDARARAVDALDSVGVPEPSRRLRSYPHELSGGMRQRAMIGIGLMGRPRLLIADEPTTALDVTVQRRVLGVLRTAQEETGSAILFISHDIALVSGFCDRVLVMKDGRIVEELDAGIDAARHPYTQALIGCVPHLGTDRSQPLPVIEDRIDELEASEPEPEVST